MDCKKDKRITFLNNFGTMMVCVLFLSPIADAATRPGRSAQDYQKANAEIKKLRDKKQEVFLKHLKKTDPAAYDRYKMVTDNQKKIDKILSDYKRGKISQTDARRKLTPIVEELHLADLATIDKRIADTTKALDELKAQAKTKATGQDLQDKITSAEKKLKSLQETKTSPQIQVGSRVEDLLKLHRPKP